MRVKCQPEHESWDSVSWPSELCYSPSVGDWIQAIDIAYIQVRGEYANSRMKAGLSITVKIQEPALKITCIIHKQDSAGHYLEISLAHPSAVTLGYV